jgi:dihydroneopterin aldolase
MEITINVEGIRVWGHHGVYASEAISGNWFLVDVSVKANVDTAGITNDDLSATCDYQHFHKIVVEVMSSPVKLLEKLALQIASEIKHSDTRIINARVKVAKLQPPLKGEVEATSVEVVV